MNGGRDSLDIEGNGYAVTRGSTSSVAHRESETEKTKETREVLAEIVKLLTKALVLALRLCGGMVGARSAGLLTQEGQRPVETSDEETADEEKKEDEEEETSSEGLDAAVDER